MPRPKDEFFWNYFDKTSEGLVCKYCKKLFRGSPSISRTKYHIIGTENRGISVCEKVPSKDREEAKLHDGECANKRQKIMPSSSNCCPHNETSNNFYAQGNGLENQPREPGITGTQQQNGEEHFLSPVELGHFMGSPPSLEQPHESGGFPEGSIQLHKTEGTMLLVTDPVGREFTENMDQIGSWFEDDGGFPEGSIELHKTEGTMLLVTDPVGREFTENMDQIGSWFEDDGGFPEGSIELHKTEGTKLLVTDPVGWEFTENMDQIWSWLEDDGVSSIGIYGMGGVGKTELAKHINNKLIDTPNPFLHVYWVGVPRDFSIIKLQNAIAEVVGLSLSSLEDENVSAAKLCKTLKEKKKSVLILDNLWNDIDFQKIGISPDITEVKLILTTRFKDLCRKTSCQKDIKVKCLYDDEGWALFERTLEDKIILDSQVGEIARLIVKKCKGLPHGIIVIGRNMRKELHIEEWRCMLEELQESSPRQDIMEVFETLQLSYNLLNDSTLQQLFLSCALHDYEDEVDDLKRLIVTEINGGMKRGRRQLDKACSMIQKLENASLFDRDWRGYINIHPLIRILAIRIMKGGGGHMVEVSNKQIKELPTEERWTTDLTKVVLVDTAIKKIRPDHPPGCPDLTVMLLYNNRDLEFIHYSFFQRLYRLQILDLSGTAIQGLPDSVSDLVNLSSLLLCGCRSLKNLPSLEKLRALKKLDMNRSAVENVPDGMGFLHNLNYLDLSYTEIKTIAGGILSNLSNLQFLALHTLVNAEEFTRLTNLETLMCLGVSSLKTFLRTLNTEWQHVDNFFFLFGSDFEHYFVYEYDRSVVIGSYHDVNEDEDGDVIFVPTNIQLFELCSSIGRSLCVGSKSELKCLYIVNCGGMEYLTCDLVFERLEILHLFYLKKLHGIFNREGWPPLGMLLSPDGTFCHLRELSLVDCPSIKYLFPTFVLPNLRNLEQIKVWECELLEEIVGSDPQQFSLATNAVNQFSLPKLKSLELKKLPQLKSICWRKLICNSLQELVVVNCPKLGDIPVSLPIQSLEKVRAYPENWWQGVRWENPNAKALVPVKITEYGE